MTTGTLSVLNVGAGDIEVRFNQHQPDELKRALKMLTDMQKRGYAILVKQDDGSYARATSIDAARGLYIISGEPAPTVEAEVVTETAMVHVKRPGASKGARGRRGHRTQPIVSSEAIGIGRSAGG